LQNLLKNIDVLCENTLSSRVGEQGDFMERVAIYYRVSTDKQDFESQRETITRWLDALPENKKPKDIKVFMDEGISGKTTQRPGYQEMLRHAFEKRIDTIIVYKLDRLSRNATHAIKILLDLDEVGVAFISVTQPVLNLGHENPFRRTMLAAFAEIAEIERETTVARVKSGLEAARRRGVKLGPPTKVTKEKQQEARRLKGEGLSYGKIAKMMELSVGAVHKMVTGEEVVE
jgi:DNA invertase Pin-like site-specific DNA recombinase